MDYDSSTGKVVLSDGPYMPLSKPFPCTSNPKIQRTRQIHFILNGILLILSVVDLILGITGVKFLNDQGMHIRAYYISQASIWILLNIFGLFVAYKYNRIGLHVFAWLNAVLIAILSILIIIILSIVAWLVFSKRFHENFRPSLFVIILSIVGIVFIVIRVFVIQIALKLARLINVNNKYIIESN
ncbi:unnamed protein product [Adineta steineri]|uniref:Uncharacterized protein n=1 Tax=Adineta steineri TaxID=433720 RepID=A0A819QLJ5_9BILA|nr:unnamed protein product [Adineta steineri]CAF4031352.1 unnamed protein product [Adineta steineri]